MVVGSVSVLPQTLITFSLIRANSNQSFPLRRSRMSRNVCNDENGRFHEISPNRWISWIWQFWWILVKFVKAKSAGWFWRFWRIFAIFVTACISIVSPAGRTTLVLTTALSTALNSNDILWNFRSWFSRLVTFLHFLSVIISVFIFILLNLILFTLIS